MFFSVETRLIYGQREVYCGYANEHKIKESFVWPSHVQFEAGYDFVEITVLLVGLWALCKTHFLANCDYWGFGEEASFCLHSANFHIKTLLCEKKTSTQFKHISKNFFKRRKFWGLLCVYLPPLGKRPTLDSGHHIWLQAKPWILNYLYYSIGHLCIFACPGIMVTISFIGLFLKGNKEVNEWRLLACFLCEKFVWESKGSIQVI